MFVNSALKTYNAFMINSLKTNKFTILTLATLTALGYLSIPYLEKYHKTIKSKSETRD